jgi:hypothetical protein
MNFKKTSDISVRKIEGEIFIFDRKNTIIHTFNKTGAFLWEMAQNSSTAEAMVDALMEKYDVTREIAEKDVLEFFADLQKNRLVEPL